MTNPSIDVTTVTPDGASANAQQRRRPIPALTGLRFLAALFIVVYHEAPDHIPHPPRLIGNFLDAGHVSVGLFFVLSGFILVYNYAPAVGRRQRSPRSFLVARFARIYPVYLLGIALALPRFWQTVHESLTVRSSLVHTSTVTGASLLLIQSWFPSMAYQLNGPGWSLSAEAFFYLTFPFTMLVVMSQYARRHWVVFAIVLWASSLAAIIATYAYVPGVQNWLHLSRQTTWLFLVYAPLFRLPEFMIGMVLGGAFLQHDSIWSARRRLFEGVGAVAMVTLLGLLFVSRSLPDIPLHTSLLTPLFGVIILCLAVGNGYATRTLAHPSIVWLGEASYAMYILHRPLHTWLHGLDMATGVGLHNSAAWLPIYVLFVCGVSLIVLEYVEKPARNYIRQRFSESDLPSLDNTVRAIAAQDESHGTAKQFAGPFS